jgi:hypothetical protein
MLCYWSVSYFKLFVSVCVVCVWGGGLGGGCAEYDSCSVHNKGVTWLMAGSFLVSMAS